MTEDIAPDVAETSPSPEGAEPSPAPDESSTQDAEPTVADPESPPEPAKSRAAERIAGLVGDNKALREYGEHMRHEVLRLSEQAKTSIPQDTATPRPKLEDFDHDQDQWAEAFSSWSMKEASKVAEAQVTETLKQQASANEQAALRATWEQRSEEFAEKNPDFRSVTGSESLVITKDMAEIFMESDVGPAIAYYLGKNPDKSARISRMKPRQMALAIGRLESEVNKPAPKPQPTSAPQPPSPVGGQQPTVDIYELPIEDYMAQERARLSSKRR